jgi:transient receptor potential cation channel subfamily A protein 1
MSQCSDARKGLCSLSNVTSLNCSVVVDVGLGERIKNCENNHAVISFWFFYLATMGGTCVMIFREIVLIMFSGKQYFRLWDNLLEILILVCTVVFLAMSWFNLTAARHFATWSVFFGWLGLTLFIGRIPSIGIYIYMSFRVISTLMQFIVVFSPVLAAYVFAFCIIHPKAKVFDNPFTSFLKVLVMMTGEFSMEEYFIWQSVKDDKGFVTTQIIFVLFVFFISIVLVNLLVGLTVSKTEELFKEAGIYRLEKTVLQV